MKYAFIITLALAITGCIPLTRSAYTPVYNTNLASSNGLNMGEAVGQALATAQQRQHEIHLAEILAGKR